jgi:carboxypeptidase C (cathepsin A)
LGLNWKGGDDFRSATTHDWGNGSGLARTLVYDAGHMVPADQPEVALNMMRAFISGEKFS